MAVAHELADGGAACGARAGLGGVLGVAAQVEGFGAVHHQQADRAMALDLDGEAAGLLEVVADHADDGAHFAEQVRDRRRGSRG